MSVFRKFLSQFYYSLVLCHQEVTAEVCDPVSCDTLSDASVRRPLTMIVGNREGYELVQSHVRCTSETRP